MPRLFSSPVLELDRRFVRSFLVLFYFMFAQAINKAVVQFIYNTKSIEQNRPIAGLYLGSAAAIHIWELENVFSCQIQ